MRNYWLRIALGALAIFTVGMIAHSLIHKGVNSVKGVVEGSGPLSIPLAFVPFRLGGDKLGTLERLTLRRETPTHVTSVELGIKLKDSLVARGLEGFASRRTSRIKETGIAESTSNGARFPMAPSGASERTRQMMPSSWNTDMPC